MEQDLLLYSSLASEYIDRELEIDRTIELRAMVNMLRRSEGFTLAFALCNRPGDRRRVVSDLRQLLGDYSIAETEFTEPIEHLLDELIPRLPEYKDARALFIYGMEHSIRSDREFSPLVANLNVSRNLFPRHISRAIVIWLPAFAMVAIMRGAPDFFSWRSALYQFPCPPEVFCELSEDVLAGDTMMVINLTLEEKKERIDVIEDLMAEYETLPPDRRDRWAECRLSYRLAMLYYSLSDYGRAESSFHYNLEIARELNYENGVVRSLDQLGKIARLRGDFEDAELYYQQSLGIREKLGDRVGIAVALHNLGLLAQLRGSYEEAEHYYKQNLEIIEKLEYGRGTAIALSKLGAIAQNQGHLVEAKHYQRLSLNISRKLGNELDIAVSLQGLGLIAQEMRNYEEAEHYYKQSVEINNKRGNKLGAAIALSKLGVLAHERGHLAAAQQYQQQSLDICKELGNKLGMVFSLSNLGRIAQDRGNYKEAERYYQRSLKMSEELADKNGMAFCLNNLGRIAHLRGEYIRAVQILGAALAIFEQIGSVHQEVAERNLTRLREQIGELRFKLLLKEAKADPEEVVREVLKSEEKGK